MKFRSADKKHNRICCYGGTTNKPSTICKHQQQFRRDEQRQATVLSIIFIDFIWLRHGAGNSTNAGTATSPDR